ncbi:interleukin-1 receptor antagonist protein-like [Pleurodeles waltl]
MENDQPDFGPMSIMQTELMAGDYGAEAFAVGFKPAKLSCCDFSLENEEIPRSDTVKHQYLGGTPNQVFRHFSDSRCYVTDTANKSLVLNNTLGQAQLVARYLQGPDVEHQATLNMNLYSWLPGGDSTKRPVTLNILGSSLFLSCALVDGKPKLCIEEVSEKLTTLKSTLLHFLFLKGGEGSGRGATSTFESATCPEWFLSTSQHENLPVTVSSSGDQRSIQNFKVIQL